MGVYMDLYVSPEAGFIVSREKFVSLVTDLISNDFVATYCAICEGEFELDSPLGMVDDFYAERFTNKNINIHYKGESLEEILKTLKIFPFGKANLCIWFAGFNWENHILSDNFRDFGYANASILLFALASPQKTILHDAYDASSQEYDFSTIFVTTGKNGPTTIKDTVIEPLLLNSFGQNLIEYCAYS
jgi:hypothetical protein